MSQVDPKRRSDPERDAMVSRLGDQPEGPKPARLGPAPAAAGSPGLPEATGAAGSLDDRRIEAELRDERSRTNPV